MEGFDLDLIARSMPRFLAGAWVAIYISIASLVLAIFLGLLVALARLSRSRLARAVARIYVDLIRGIPALLLIFFVFFALPSVGFKIDAITAGIVALGLNSGAYMGEIFRSGIQSIDRGQYEAARSLGMNHVTAMRRVVLPQAVRQVIPPATGETTNIVKGTSLLSAIAIVELTRVGQQIVNTTFRPVEAFLVVAIFYLVINSVVSLVSTRIERRLEIPT